MPRMRTTLARTALAMAACAGLAAPARAVDPKIERGRYLTHDVAMCVQCHSPRTHDGTLIETREFLGAPVPFERPPFPNMRWAARAPAIAGLPGFSDEDEITLLTTGHRPSGRTPDPPMPPFRFSRADAEAIVAYLRSLGPGPSPR
jgi:mono/diheme cytochrome c family protein